jgi:hypothetical protein
LSILPFLTKRRDAAPQKLEKPLYFVVSHAVDISVETGLTFACLSKTRKPKPIPNKLAIECNACIYNDLRRLIDFLDPEKPPRGNFFPNRGFAQKKGTLVRK